VAEQDIELGLGHLKHSHVKHLQFLERYLLERVRVHEGEEDQLNEWESGDVLQ
jgi:hypothetical protein